MNSKYYNPLITNNHEVYRNKVRDFAEQVIKPQAPQLDETGTFSVEITKQMGEQGLLGIQIPKEYGGQALDTISYIIAIEELARIDGSHAATVAAHNSLGIGPIAKYGTIAQKEKYLPTLSNSGKLWAFGLTEPKAGSDANSSQTNAVKNGDSWIINGHKVFITNSASDLSAGVTIQAVTSEKDGKKRFTSI